MSKSLVSRRLIFEAGMGENYRYWHGLQTGAITMAESTGESKRVSYSDYIHVLLFIEILIYGHWGTYLVSPYHANRDMGNVFKRLASG